MINNNYNYEILNKLIFHQLLCVSVCIIMLTYTLKYELYDSLNMYVDNKQIR